MLLTLPWFLAVFAGRVDLEDGSPRYKPALYDGVVTEKLTQSGIASFLTTGVGVGAAVRNNSKFMVFTALIYFIIQVPASLYQVSSEAGIAGKEGPYALGGGFVAFIALVYYLYLQVAGSQRDNQQVIDKRIAAIKSGVITLRGAMAGAIQHVRAKHTEQAGPAQPFNADTELAATMSKVLSPFFSYYDANNNKTLDKMELRIVLRDLQENLSSEEFEDLWSRSDTDGSNAIDFNEFVRMMLKLCEGQKAFRTSSARKSTVTTMPARMSMLGRDFINASSNPVLGFEGKDEDGDDEEEEETVPEDLADLSPEQQQLRVKFRAAWMMAFGVALIMLFSDPAVNVMDELGKRTGISSFYISFVLAPIASNGSELYGALNYAQRQTQKSMTISLSTLIGAACMNNTYCLGIFLIMIYISRLTWTFTAETLSIVAVELMVAIISQRRVHRLIDGCMVLVLYPASLAFVYILEKCLHID